MSKTLNMSKLFSNPAGESLLASLREVFQKKKIFHQEDRFILFVCGGKIEKEGNSLRSRFISWAEDNLQEFVCLVAEEAMKDSFAEEGLTFVNLAKFELIIGEVADCVLIFPESDGSFAEVGFFANSKIGEKTLVINPFDLQAEDSFLNLGPIETINERSTLRSTILLIDVDGGPDFTPIRKRLIERVKRPGYRVRLPYEKFGSFSFKQKLSVVFEVLRFLRLANLRTLRETLVACFDGNPRNQELKHILSILLAAKFIQRREDGFFKVTPEVALLYVEHFDIEQMFAQIDLFYKKHSPELYEALTEIAP